MKNLIISCLCWTAMSFCSHNILDAFKLSNPPRQVLASFMSCKDLQNLSATACDTNEISKPYLDGRIHQIVEPKKLSLMWLTPNGRWCQETLDLRPIGEILKMQFDHSQAKYEYYCIQLKQYYEVSSTKNGSVDFEDPNFLLNQNNIQVIRNLLNAYIGIRPDRKAAAEKFYALMLEVRRKLLTFPVSNPI